MTKKPKASENLAKDIETPKTRRVDIPDVAKMEIARITQNMNDYVAGVVAGLGIEGKWSIDMQKMQFVVKDEK